MSGLLDTLGDLIHRAVDTSSGDQKEAAPIKPAYTHQDASAVLGGAAGSAADTLRNRRSQIDKAVDDAG